MKHVECERGQEGRPLSLRPEAERRLLSYNPFKHRLNTVARTWLDVGGYCSSPVALLKSRLIKGF